MALPVASEAVHPRRKGTGVSTPKPFPDRVKLDNIGLCGILHAHVLQYSEGVQQVSEGPSKVHGAAPAPSPRRRGAAGYQVPPPGMPGLRPSLSCAAPLGRKPNMEQDSAAEVGGAV